MFLITWGVRCAIFIASRCGFRYFVIGCAFIIVGWFGIPFQDDLLSFIENASVSPGPYGASAPSYGRAEDVGVAPIIVAPFEHHGTMQVSRGPARQESKNVEI